MSAKKTTSRSADKNKSSGNGRQIHNALETRNGVLSFLAEALAIVLLAVYPLYLNSDRYIALVKHKVWFFWVVTLLFVAAFAVVCIAFIGIAKTPGQERRRRLISVADWAALSYFACIILSCIFSPYSSYELGVDRLTYFIQGNLHDGMWRYEGLLTKGLYLLIYFLISRMFVPRERVWIIFAVSANILALIGFFQFIGMDFLELFPYATHGFDYPYSALDIIFRTTLGNVDILSAYVGLVVPFFSVLYCKGKGRLRFLYLGAMAANMLLMVLGGADGGILGVGVAMLAVMVFVITDRTALSRLFFGLGVSALICATVPAAHAARDYYNSTGIMRSMVWSGFFSDIWPWAALAAVAVAAAIRFLPIPFNPEKYRLAGLITTAAILITGIAGLEVAAQIINDDQNTIYQARQVMHGHMGDHYGSWRGIVWKRSVQVISEHPLLGTGPDTFGYAYDKYQEEVMALTGVPFDKAHNELLETAVCSGLLGMAAYMVFCAAVFAAAIPWIQNSPWLLAATVGALGFFVQSLFGVSVPIVTPLFYVMLGVIASMVNRFKMELTE